jgi:hypothetical protein
MRSRLGIAISAGKLDLPECGPAAEEGQPRHDHIPLLFYRRAFDAGRRPSPERFSQKRLSTTGRRTSTVWQNKSAKLFEP